MFLIVLLLLLVFSCEKEDSTSADKNEPWDKAITAITIQKNIVWVGTNGNGLYKLDGETWKNYTKSNALLSDNITSLLIDNNESLWVGTSAGLSRFENGNWSYFTETEGLFNNDIRSLACDQVNNIWIGTRNNRIVKYDGTVFNTYHVNPEESGEGEMGHIHSITSDLSGNVWAGSCISGLSKFDGVTWFDYVNDLRSFVTSSICTEDGDLWIGHYTGAYNYSNGVWIKYSETNGLANNSILCIDFDQHNNIWFGTEHGISKFDGISWTNYNIDNNFINEYISGLACDKDGNIWAGNYDGLIKYSPNQ